MQDNLILDNHQIFSFRSGKGIAGFKMTRITKDMRTRKWRVTGNWTFTTEQGRLEWARLRHSGALKYNIRLDYSPWSVGEVTVPSL